ncbi:hypothetical protein KQX54_016283 [Cotesia glomerata]|uniref:Uncharacterized protein n=1 Tax=Cotesia glomerata TaxID=32391 RepID=A0AAV7IYD0_COTGL|nr:hypothetical protein KQX54_016283 [Cotesia glomerata]
MNMVAKVVRVLSKVHRHTFVIPQCKTCWSMRAPDIANIHIFVAHPRPRTLSLSCSCVFLSVLMEKDADGDGVEDGIESGGEETKENGD